MPTVPEGKFEYPTEDWATGRMKKAQSSNIEDATSAMKLNEQEQFLYRRHLDNLWGPGGVDNPDGSRSSLKQITVGIEGKTYNIPTIWGGKERSVESSIDQARIDGLDKFPSYKTQAQAEARYQQMHDYMQRDTQEYQRSMATPSAAPAQKWYDLPHSQRVEDVRGQPKPVRQEGEPDAADWTWDKPPQPSWPYDPMQKALGLEKLRSMESRGGRKRQR